MAPSDKQIDAHLHLLDRQILDVDGRMVANVDDVEIEEQPDGTYAVVGLLLGPAALGPRIPGLIGRGMTAIWSRLAHKDSTEPGRIDMSVVREIGSAVTLTVRRDDVYVAGFETWCRTRIIEKIPGAAHEPEE